MTDALLAWPLAYLLHSSLLLGAAALLAPRLPRAWAEWAWRCALFGGFVTSIGPLALDALHGPFDAPGAAAPVQVSTPAAPAAPSRIAAPWAAMARETPTAPARRETPTAPARHETQATVATRAAPPAPAPAATGTPSAHAGALGRAPAAAWWLPGDARPAALALAAAAFGVALLRLAALFVQAWQLRRAVRRLTPCADAGWREAAAQLARAAGLAAPPLRISAQWASPLVATGGTICLPRWCVGELDGAARDAVLAHEIAHLARRDPAWRLAGEFAARLGSVQPLNRFALRRLDALAEQACDERGARAAGSALAMAEALHACAQALLRQRSPTLAVAMAGRHSPLMQRITHLLEHTPMTDVRPNRTLRWLLAGTALVAAAAVLPRIHVEAGALLPSLDELFGEGRVTRIATREPGIVQEIRIRGTATLAADSDRLGTVGGEIRIEETRDGHTRTLRITPAANGTLAHEWKLDGQVRPFDADAQAWLDARMPILVRHLSTPADRVVRLLRRGGQEAVLQAIERSGDAFDRARLTEALAARGPLDDAALARLIDAAPERADFERREALAALARSQPMDSARQVAWLRAAGGIASDFDRRSALEALAPKLRPEPAVLDAWRGTLGTMGSDFDRRSAIEALLARDQPSPAVLDAALQALRPIGSDFDRRTVLERIAPRLTGPAAALVPQYTQAAAALGGGFEQRSALVALIDAVPLDATGCLAVMDALDHVTSSFDLLTTLQALAPKLPADAVLVSRYRRLARHLDTFERGQAEQAIDKLERG